MTRHALMTSADVYQGIQYGGRDKEGRMIRATRHSVRCGRCWHDRVHSIRQFMKPAGTRRRPPSAVHRRDEPDGWLAPDRGHDRIRDHAIGDKGDCSVS